MYCKGKYNSAACGFIGVLISIVIGVIIGILFALGFIPNIVTAVWIVFGLAVLTLIILVTAVFLAVCCKSEVLPKCLKRNIGCLLVGIFGTLISALTALSIGLNTVVWISTAILVGIGAFFTSLMIISLILFILCIVDKLCFDDKVLYKKN